MDAKDFLNAARDLCLSIDCEDCKFYVVGHGCILFNEPANYNVDMIMGTFDVAIKKHDKPVVKIKIFRADICPSRKPKERLLMTAMHVSVTGCRTCGCS